MAPKKSRAQANQTTDASYTRKCVEETVQPSTQPQQGKYIYARTSG